MKIKGKYKFDELIRLTYLPTFSCFNKIQVLKGLWGWRKGGEGDKQCNI